MGTKLDVCDEAQKPEFGCGFDGGNTE